MIFVTLGTQELEFKRLLDYIENMEIDEDVVIQCGHTKFESEKYEVVDFLSPEKFNDIMEECNLLICHGGVGSILSALKKGKKVVVVPRLSKYKEHIDDHQIEICKKFDEKGYIKYCLDFSSLEENIKNYKNIKFNKYKFNNSKLLEFIEGYIKNI